ncbi:MAG: hypothetical protein Q7K36_02295, partial [Fusobacterium sp. JB020]|nr:hypothetical protein [Fusobacterium sp. JB020]
MLKKMLDNIKLKKVEKDLKDLFKESSKIYSLIMDEIENDISKISFYKDIEIKRSSMKENIRKNFFTLFMLSLIEFLDIPKENKIKYGKCIFYLRGIITCTDNIIDDEKKGTIFLKGISEHVTENTLLTLFLYKNLEDILNSLDEEKRGISYKILEEIHIIAKSEGLRDCSLYEIYPSYKYIFNEIHSGIGGELLKIGLIAPKYLENDKNINRCLDSLYKLGLSLQGLDDLCDMKEDYDERKINLGIAFFMEKYSILEKEASEIDILNDKSTKEYLYEILEYALESFKYLENIGYPVDRKLGIKILKSLFLIFYQ